MLEQNSDFINWSRLGDEVRVNGEDVYYHHNADLVEMVHGAGSFESTYQRQIGKSAFDLFDGDFEPGSLELVFYIPGRSKQEALEHASSLVASMTECTVKTGDDLNAEFACVLDSYDIELTGIEWVIQLTVSLACIRRLGIRRVKASGASSVVVNNPGSLVSGVKITVKSSTARSNVSVAGIMIDSLKANMPFTIDGISGEVLENGVNKILSTDLSTFPRVKPGKSTLTSNYSLDWEIEFYPTFVI